MNTMIQGSCLCGEIRFEMDPEAIALFNQCYCTLCRKNTGTSHTSQLAVAKDSFAWLAGENEIKTYESSPGNFRAFCGICGSRLPQYHTRGVFVSVPAGLLNTFPNIQPEISIHVQSKAPWDKLDPEIVSIPDQGSEEFWHEFMQGKAGGT